MVAIETGVPTVSAAPSADAIPLKLRRSGGSPRQVLALTLIGALVLAVFASHDLSTWLDRLGGGPIVEPLQRVAAQWDGAMDRLGLGYPHEALRAAIGRLLDWQWGGPP
jgi:hypothetical protein